VYIDFEVTMHEVEVGSHDTALLTVNLVPKGGLVSPQRRPGVITNELT
jgi:hypothetical protein